VIESNGGTRKVTVAGDPALELVVDRFSLTVEEGPDRGRSVLLSSTSVRIGTADGNDLVLSDPTVSRRHALFIITASGIIVEDAESRNGTLVDGTRIRSAFVTATSIIQVGATILKIAPTASHYLVVPDPEESFEGMKARSTAMRETFSLIRQLAKTDLPVSITGETGTGKELVARALHRAGPRREKNFLVLDCGSILPELLRSELFGYEKGAFTGADKSTKGILEEAEGGTVFLDEVGEIDISVQPNLLRALETREAVRLGSRKPVPVDFRIVSATNRDLRKRCQEGAFREDLYYRLSCVTIQLPSLRERVEDIPLLATHFLAECAQRNQTANPGFSPGAMTVLEGYSWPGNLRELKNVVEAGWVFAGGKPLLEQHVRSALGPKLEPDILPVVPAPEPALGSLEQAERHTIEAALLASNWNRKAAAQALGISRQTMFTKIRQYGLKPPG
jgi:DNA-binding NtrC family response regulator